MARRLKLLLIEDDPSDALLLERELECAGFACEVERVCTEAAFLGALAHEWDLVISDWTVPGFGAMQALDMVLERRPETPFIVVSGTIGEDVAVTALKRGAQDFLRKEHLTRLGPAISQTLERARLRREGTEAEQRLRVSEEQFRQVVENIHEVFWLADATTGRILYLSPRFEAIWGRACDPAQTSLADLGKSVHPADAEAVRDFLDRIPREKCTATFRIVPSNGLVRWVRARTFPIQVGDGRVERVVGIAEDITERKQLEAQFLHSQRLEAVGTLAGGMAHDLNNILAPMLIAAGLLKESVQSERDREMLEMIERNAQRGANIIRQLLTFSRGIEGDRQPVLLTALAREMGQIVRETFPRAITLVEELPNSLWPVLADPTQVHQVMVNLCVNARDAMPEGGRLKLSARNVVLDAATAKPGARPGRYVVFAVADTGMGMPPEVIDHIFEPFFTTKGVGKGTGLGLSTVQGIVRSHGGFIDVLSAPGQGSTFEVYFPAALGVDATTHVQVPLTPGRGQGQTILVVDDEAAVRDSIRQALERANYQVITAANGREGLTTFLRHRDAVQLVITDAMMPEMDGATLVRALRSLDGNLRFVALSGLGSDHADMKAVGVTAIVAKPCGPHELLGVVQQELA